MPYGLKKKMDTPSNNKWMEDCVKGVMEGGKDKGAAVAICKVQLTKKKAKSELDLTLEDAQTAEAGYKAFLEDISDQVWETFVQPQYEKREALRPEIPPVNYYSVEEMEDDYFIMEVEKYETEEDIMNYKEPEKEYWKVPYTVVNNEVVIDWSKKEKVVEVTSFEAAEKSGRNRWIVVHSESGNRRVAQGMTIR